MDLISGFLLRLLRLFAAVTLVACADAAPLVVATYNVRNYNSIDRLTPEGFRPDYPKPEVEKVALRTVIRAVNADILVLQEIGPPPYLDELRRDLKGEGLDYPFALVLDAGDPDRHVAFLSRIAPRKIVPHPVLGFTYFKQPGFVKRGLLEVVFPADSGDFTLFALHLKSRLTERNDDPLSAIRREAEATTIRDFVLDRFPQPATARFIIIGDCNDGPGSKPLERLLHRGTTDISTLVPAADSHGEHWTYFYSQHDEYSRVDLILLSPGLAAVQKNPVAHIYDGPPAMIASDHRLVSVKLDL